MKIVINTKHGGFDLSELAVKRYLAKKNIHVWVEKCRNFTYGVDYWLASPEDRLDKKSGKEYYNMDLDARRAYNKEYEEQTFWPRDISRNDPVLVEVVEEMGSDADGRYASLKVVEIPDDVEWEIQDYDGKEWIAEKHRTWR